MGYLSEALSAGATELADDFAAHGQKRLTGHPACQLSPPAPSERAVGQYRVRSSTHLPGFTETLMSGFRFALYITSASSLVLHLLQFRAPLYSKALKHVTGVLLYFTTAILLVRDDSG